MATVDLEARADRLRDIVEAVHGRVNSRNCDTVVIEVPADLISSAVTLFGMGGFSATIGKQSTRLAERGVVDTNGNTATCPAI